MSPATSTLTAYFDGSDTQFGIFYPHHHLVAVFASLAEATRARKTLVDSGHSGADCITAGGEEVVLPASGSSLDWKMLYVSPRNTCRRKASGGC